MASSNGQSLPQSFLEEDRSYQIVATAVAFLVLEVVATALRVLARHLHKSRWIWGDIFMPVSLLFNIGVCVCSLVAVRYGAGKHIQAVPESSNIPFTITDVYAVACLYLGAVAFPKLAILDVYLHICVDKFSRYASYGMGVITVLNLIANFITLMAQCRPVAYLWDPTIEGGSCIDIRVHFVWASLPNIITDLGMLLLPLPMIWKLQASWQTKVGVFLTLLFGGLGLVTSIVRFYEFSQFAWVADDYPDQTWVSVAGYCWTIVEGGVYHLAACFITFRPLLRLVTTGNPLSSMLSRSRATQGAEGSRRGTLVSIRRLTDRKGSEAENSEKGMWAPQGDSGNSVFALATHEEANEFRGSSERKSVLISHSFQVSTQEI